MSPSAEMSPSAGAAPRALRPPAHAGYFADPFLVRASDGSYAAYGTQPGGEQDAPVFEVLLSPDLTSWRSGGPVLQRVDPALGDEYWAPEVCRRDGAWWMYYSVGRGIHGHHIRVARSEDIAGPFIDLGVDLTPGDSFAIDAHPFQDPDGQWYLYYARDVLDAERPGTHLAVGRLDDPAVLTDVRPALAPNSDWQVYERGRRMYDRVLDWHTLEGPSVVKRRGRHWMTFSGGAWTGPGYAVAWATAPNPLGPWTHAPAASAPVLSTGSSLVGPGHNSLAVGPEGGDVIAFHSWSDDGLRRELHIAPIDFTENGPVVDLG